MATFERLEPYVRKPTSTVIMGLGSGNGPWLPDVCQFYAVTERFYRKQLAIKSGPGNAFVQKALN
jgi:hypothetical protein